MKKYIRFRQDSKLFFLAFLVLTITYSCQKFDKISTETPVTEEAVNMNDIVVPDGFKWQTSQAYDFNISGGALGEVIKITSEDGTVVYNKGTYIEDNGAYKVSLRLPTHITSVKINSVSVDLGGTYLTHDLSTKATLINYALSFDGIDDYVNLGDVSELNNATTFTIEGWAQQTNNTDNESLFYKYFDGNNDILISPWGGDFYIELGNGSNSYAYWDDYAANIASNTWFHFAVVYDGFGFSDSDKLKLYINGVQETLLFTGSIPATTSSSLTATDAYLSYTSDFFGGELDEFRIWNDVRTITEINNFMNIKVINPTADASLVAYYGLDQGTGSTAFDYSVNSYNASMNGPSWVLYTNAWDSDGDGVADLTDDYWDDPLRAYDNYYPAADTGTVVFEDLWPGTGDYDFNDLVIGYQFKTVTNASNQVTEIYTYLEVRAHGAQLDNGFGFQLPNANASVLTDVVVTGYNHTTGLITLDANNFESGQTNPVIIAIDKITNLMAKFENTDNWKPTIPYAPMTIAMTVTDPPVSDLYAADFDVQNWDPFMFIDQIRGYEVHKIDVAPTNLVNPAYFGTFEDVSVPGNGEYYRSYTGLPWVLEFQTSVEYPFEKSDITYAYLHFREWAESAGVLYTDWYSNSAFGYRNTNHIYN